MPCTILLCASCHYYNPSTDPINRLATHEQTTIVRLQQDTVACEHTWSKLESWTLQSAIAKKQNRQSTTSSMAVISGGNRDTSYGSRTDSPPHPPWLLSLVATETPVMAAEQTVHHILHGCSLWWQQRHQLWQQNRQSTTSSTAVLSGGNRNTSYGSRTDSPPHPPRLFSLVATETPVMAAEQTVHHILHGCSLWWQQRHQLWQQNRQSTTSSTAVLSGGNRDTSYGSRTDSPPHPQRLFSLVATETPVMAAECINHHQAVGNGGRPAPHHPIPGKHVDWGSKHGWSTAEEEEDLHHTTQFLANMWTEGLSTADPLQKKKKTCTTPPNSWQTCGLRV